MKSTYAIRNLFRTLTENFLTFNLMSSAVMNSFRSDLLIERHTLTSDFNSENLESVADIEKFLL